MLDEDISVADGWRVSGKVIAFSVIILVVGIVLATMWMFGWGLLVEGDGRLPR